jgi:hypothetical protein
VNWEDIILLLFWVADEPSIDAEGLGFGGQMFLPVPSGSHSHAPSLQSRVICSHIVNEFSWLVFKLFHTLIKMSTCPAVIDLTFSRFHQMSHIRSVFSTSAK